MLIFCGTTLLDFVDSPGNAEQSVDSLSCHLLAQASAAVQSCRSGQGDDTSLSHYWVKMPG